MPPVKAEDNLSAQTNQSIAVVGDSAGYVHCLTLDGLNKPSEFWPKVLLDIPIQTIHIADLDRDGIFEILAGATLAYEYGILYCLDGETGEEKWRYPSPYDDFCQWVGIYTEDIDNDGKLEVIAGIVVDTPPNERYYGSGGGIVVLDHDGTEKTNLRYDSPLVDGWNGNGPTKTSMGDFNGDGIRDLVFMLGGHLYPDPQPWIQVIDFTGSAPEIIHDFRHTYTGSGMIFLQVSDVNGDGELDFMTGGWWCPVAVFNNTGSLLWERDVEGGGGGDRVLYTRDIDGTGRQALIIATSEYWYTTEYLYAVDPTNGIDLFAPIPIHDSRLINPVEVADVDGDTINEILAFSKGEEINELFCMNGKNGEVEWRIESDWTHGPDRPRRCLIAADIDADGASEIYTGRGRSFTCVKGDSSILWDYELGARLTDFEIVTVAPPELIHDIAIREVSRSADEVKAGEPVFISVTVVNEGNFSETFDVTTYYDANIIGTQTVTDLAPGSSITLSFTWNTLAIEGGTYTISVYASVVSGETETADNFYIDGIVTVIPTYIAEIEVYLFWIKKDCDNPLALDDDDLGGAAEPYFKIDVRGVDDDEDGVIDDVAGDWFRSPEAGHELWIADDEIGKHFVGPIYIPRKLLTLPITLEIEAWDKDPIWDDLLGEKTIVISELPAVDGLENENIYFWVQVREIPLMPFSHSFIDEINDPFIDHQWYWFDVGANLVWHNDHYRNQLTEGSSEVIVAVLDTGVDYTHDDLADHMWIHPDGWYGYDFVDDDNDPMDEGVLINGQMTYHGTNVAGIIAAVPNNTEGIAGIALNARIMAIRIVDTGDLYPPPSRVKDGIYYAVRNGAKIISMSFSTLLTDELKEAIDYAYKHGVVLVTSSGNYRTSKQTFPSIHDKVISVSALERSRVSNLDLVPGVPWPSSPSSITFAYEYSNYGPDGFDFRKSIELTAPGTLILSTNITVDPYSWGDGTSLSCPIIAGTAALIIGYTRGYYGVNLNPAEVRYILRETTLDLGPSKWDPYYGWGMVNAYTALQKVDELFSQGGFVIKLDPPDNIDLHVYDSLGRHVGVNYEADQQEVEIPGAAFTGDETDGFETIFLPLSVEFPLKIEIVGKEVAECTYYTLTIIHLIPESTMFSSEWSFTGEIVEGAIYTYSVKAVDEVITVTPDAVTELMHFKHFIMRLSEDVFDQPELSQQRKRTLCNKIDEVIEKIRAGNYTDAINKLFYDIRAKMDGDSTAEDWIIDPVTQFRLCVIIDHIILSIETLRES
jgi:outer membrane protein assembly factor BamB